MIKIYFGKSTSQNYSLALKRAKRDSTHYEEEVVGKSITHKVEYDIEKLPKAFKLWETVKGWKTTELFIDGEPAGWQELSTLGQTLDCSKRRIESILPDDYCTDGQSDYDQNKYFGCKRLESVLREVTFSDNSYYYRDELRNIWYRKGHLDKEKNVFYVDKERIKKMLLAEAKKKLVTACPFYQEDVLLNMVDELPSEIDLTDNEEYLLDEEGPVPLIRTKEEVEHLKKEKSRYSLSFNLNAEGENDEPIPETTNISYNDLGGLDEEIRMVRECVEIPFKYPEIFEHLSISAYKGILFYGPPGTGKTQLAKAVANEASMNFYTVSGPEIFDKYFGESERKLREIFDTAKKNAPSIIFFDEIDSIAAKREDGSEIYNKIVTQLLTLMDGMEEREKVIVMAATNRPNSLDPALRRPGRFDFEIYVSPPDEKGREEILKIHTREMPLADDVDLEKLAKTLYGYVGADISGLCKEAALFALRRHIKEIENELAELDLITVTMDDFKQAKNKIVPTAGREVLSYKPNVKWSDVIGLEKTKMELEKKLIKPWVMKHRYKGIRRIKGLLLHGPSGVGKTYLSKALAGELGMNIISLKGSDILSKYHGDSANKLKSYFEKARELAPCMMIIDEIDAITASRDTNVNGANLVNELLSQMDGYDELTDVLVVGTTNYMDNIDKAVLRAGRFDLKVEVPYPTQEGVQALLKYYLNKSEFSYDQTLINEEFLQLKTGADVESAVNQAIYEAIWNDETELKVKHFGQ
ncbi:AAA family ATPase [Peribacillus asahii]|uniref:AAA family ATPase n=1 Tax=Peribacillus asahii TaxID=228899 RepID=UPI00207A1353|nr:AAA family ATPase [Peribacillus asahii]USK71155.1 AAA family ATPase [Peribacillus asahii]